MKLRFEIDRAGYLRRGEDPPESPFTLDVDVAKLSQGDRDLMAERLHRCDIMCGGDPWFRYGNGRKQRILAREATLQSLLEAVRQDQELFERQIAATAEHAKQLQRGTSRSVKL